MAYVTAQVPRLSTFSTQIKAVFASIAQGLGRYIESHSRVAEVERLNGLTDAELAAMGLRRDRIVHHVFSDRLWY